MDNKPNITFIARITQLTVTPDRNHDLFSELATEVFIENEGAGEFLVVSQSTDEGRGEIRIDREQWPVLRSAINRMMTQCRPAL
jgi:hypothetical protein